MGVRLVPSTLILLPTTVPPPKANSGLIQSPCREAIGFFVWAFDENVKDKNEYRINILFIVKRFKFSLKTIKVFLESKALLFASGN
jgi:hypothetical protein